MTQFHHDSDLERAIKALEKDLLLPGGPQISTSRNYNFAILPYEPSAEFTLRRHISTLSGKLRDAGWVTATIALNTLLLNRLRAVGDEELTALIEREKRLHLRDSTRALNHISEKVVQLLEGPTGIAADVVREINVLFDTHPDEQHRMVVFLGRTGSLYPFLRTSALLKHIGEHTNNVPTVLLYPGAVQGDTGLSFMGQLPPDRDYRPRIYR